MAALAGTSSSLLDLSLLPAGLVPKFQVALHMTRDSSNGYAQISLFFSPSEVIITITPCDVQ
jgi:hypothetical protein